MWNNQPRIFWIKFTNRIFKKLFKCIGWFNKKILILLDENLIILISIYKKTIFLILRICFTYKFVIRIKKNKIIFLKFLKYWFSSHGFNKLVIKTKNTC